MIKYFSRAFKITNENIILTTPLVLFFLLFVIYAGVMHNAPKTLSYTVLSLITGIFMISAFLSGWFFMVKKSVELDKRELSEDDRAKMAFGLLKEFPVGVGELFTSFLGLSVFWIVLVILFTFSVYKIGLFSIGKLSISPMDLNMALSSSAKLKTFISSLPVSEMIKLNKWNFLVFISMMLFYVVTMFWPVETVCNTKHPFKSLLLSLKFLLKNILSALILFVYVYVLYLLMSLIGYFSAINPFLYFLAMIAYFYFLVYIVVLICLYYDSERTKEIGRKDKNNSNSGSDSLGQNQLGDSESE